MSLTRSKPVTFEKTFRSRALKTMRERIGDCWGRVGQRDGVEMLFGKKRFVGTQEHNLLPQDFDFRLVVHTSQ